MKLIINFDDGIELEDITKLINEVDVNINFIKSFKIVNKEVNKC